MSSKADFRLGVYLVDPTADPIVLEFQQEFLSENRIGVHAPRGLLTQLGPDAFAEHITAYYLAEHPAEVMRVGHALVLQAVKDAIQWGAPDERHLGGLL
jgi:hypothetical protein